MLQPEPSEFAWTLPAELTVPVPEMWIALHAVSLSASIPKLYVTPGWFAATAMVPTAQSSRPMMRSEDRCTGGFDLHLHEAREPREFTVSGRDVDE